MFTAEPHVTRVFEPQPLSLIASDWHLGTQVAPKWKWKAAEERHCGEVGTVVGLVAQGTHAAGFEVRFASGQRVVAAKTRNRTSRPGLRVLRGSEDTQSYVQAWFIPLVMMILHNHGLKTTS